jgi:hypothetical protein
MMAKTPNQRPALILSLRIGRNNPMDLKINFCLYTLLIRASKAGGCKATLCFNIKNTRQR